MVESHSSLKSLPGNEISLLKEKMGFGHSAIPSSLAIPASASTAEPHTQIRTQPQPHRTTVKFRSSKSFPSARKAATLEIQRSSDLPSTLARFSLPLLRRIFILPSSFYVFSLSGYDFQARRSFDRQRPQCRSLSL